jgi:hypothetical protein
LNHASQDNEKMSKKSIPQELVEAVGAGAQALFPAEPTKPLSEMPETPLLALPEGKQATATADFTRRTATDQTS